MKVNVAESRRRQLMNRVNTALETTRTIWEIMTIKTLHEKFGFGVKRLEQFAEVLQENYEGISREADITDTYKRGSVATNLDTALIRAVRDLRADGIDYRKILGVSAGSLVIVNNDGEFSVDDFVDKLEKKERERR